MVYHNVTLIHEESHYHTTELRQQAAKARLLDSLSQHRSSGLILGKLANGLLWIGQMLQQHSKQRLERMTRTVEPTTLLEGMKLSR